LNGDRHPSRGVPNYITGEGGNMLKAVIFDLDGTLLDTLGDIHRVANLVLKAQDFPLKSLDFIRMAVGSGVGMLSRRILPEENRDDDTIGGITEAIEEEFFQNGILLTKPYPGIPEMLYSLTEKEIPMMVLTNKPQISAERAVTRFFPDIPFKCVLGVRPGFPQKPDKRVVVESLRVLDAPSSTTGIVGDSDIDMQAGTAGGLHRIGVSWGYRDVSVLKANNADIIVDSPLEILDLL